MKRPSPDSFPPVPEERTYVVQFTVPSAVQIRVTAGDESEAKAKARQVYAEADELPIETFFGDAEITSVSEV